MSYIIKNCKNLVESTYADGHIQKNECFLIESELCLCKDNSCKLKQIVDKCNEAILVSESEGLNGAYRRGLAEDILNILEIEEVRD